MFGQIGEHYAFEDTVLPDLLLRGPVEVRIDIEEEGLKLFIGPREYEWPRGCPDVRAVKTEQYARWDEPRREDL